MKLPVLVAEPPLPHSDAYWRTMRYFGFYRLIIAVLLFSTYFLFGERERWRLPEPGILLPALPC